MKLNRRNFIKGAISAIVAAVCKMMPKSLIKSEPEELQVIFGRPVQLMPYWGISADKVRARIDKIRSRQCIGPYPPEHGNCRCVLVNESHDGEIIKKGAMRGTHGKIEFWHVDAQPMEVNIKQRDVSGI